MNNCFYLIFNYRKKENVTFQSPSGTFQKVIYFLICVKSNHLHQNQAINYKNIIRRTITIVQCMDTFREQLKILNNESSVPSSLQSHIWLHSVFFVACRAGVLHLKFKGIKLETISSSKGPNIIMSYLQFDSVPWTVYWMIQVVLSMSVWNQQLIVSTIFKIIFTLN